MKKELIVEYKEGYKLIGYYFECVENSERVRIIEGPYGRWEFIPLPLWLVKATIDYYRYPHNVLLAISEFFEELEVREIDDNIDNKLFAIYWQMSK